MTEIVQRGATKSKCSRPDRESQLLYFAAERVRGWSMDSLVRAAAVVDWQQPNTGRWGSPEAPARADGSYRSGRSFSWEKQMTPLYLIVGGSFGTLARYYLSGRVDDLLGPSGLGYSW